MPIKSLRTVVLDQSEGKYTPYTPPSNQELRDLEVEREAAKPTLSEGWQAARELDSSVAALARVSQEQNYDLDFSFEVTEDKLKETGIPQEYWESLSDVRNEAHFNLRAQQVQETLANEELLGRMGLPGVATRVGANLVDEGALALGIATGPIGAAVSKASRIKRALGVGTIVAGEAAALEAYLAKADSTRDYSDVLYAGLMGFVTGGAIGGAFGKVETDNLKQLAHDYTQTMDRELLDAAARDGVVPAAGLGDSVGAAMATDVPFYHLDDALPPEVLNTPRAAMGTLRYDIVGRGMQSENEAARYGFSRLAENAVGVEGYAVNAAGGTASEITTRVQRVLEDRFRKVAEYAFADWLKETTPGIMGRAVGRMSKREEFFREVGDYIRGVKGEDVSPHTKRAAERTQQVFRDTLKELKDAGVKGFSDIPDNAKYVPRIFKWDKLREWNTRFGHRQLTQLVKKSIMKASDEMTDEAAEKVADAYLKRLHKVSTGGEDVNLGRLLSQDHTEDLAKILRDEAGLDDDHIESILYDIKKDKKGKGTISRAKRRLDMDEATEVSMKDSQTGEMVKVNISELFENNAERLLGVYLRQTTGHIGLAKAMGIKSRADWSAFLNKVRQRGTDMGHNIPKRSGGKSQLDDEIEKLQFLYDSITGVPLERDPAGLFAQSARVLRDYNFVRLMNQVGFAQIAEFGNMVGLAGWRNTLRHVPEIRAMMKRIRDTGEIEDDLAAELEAMTGLGGDRLRNQVTSMWDEEGFGAGKTGGLLHKSHAVLQHGKRLTGDLSGMAGVTMLQHRLAVKAVSQRFLNLATDGEKLTKSKMRRLKDAGLSEAMLKRVLDEMQKHATSKPSKLFKGKKLKLHNIEKWDPEVRDHYTQAIFRISRKIIQENDVGSSARWMHSTLGKSMMQFRTFMATAYTKQLLHNIHHRDIAAGQAFMLSMMLGGMSYMAQQTLNAQGREDKEEVLEERLAPAAVAKAAFQRAGFASIIPVAVDTASAFTGGEPVFAYGRSTGLATGAVSGNPTIDLLNKGQQAVRGAVGPLLHDDYEYSQKDLREHVRIMAWTNVMGIQQAINAMTARADLPKYSTPRNRQ